MESQTQFYNFKANIVLINNFRLGAWGDEGGIEYEFNDDIHRHITTADGKTVVSRVNDDDMLATISCMETSKTYARLYQFLQAQLANELGLTELPFIHQDPIIGDLVTAKHTVFLQRPSPSKAREAGMREFQILLPGAAKNMQLGTNN